jgi:dTDP-4-dehydrorhamnose reductase
VTAKVAKTLLVTGGTGYLGSAVCALAGRLGWDVVGTSYRRPGLRLDVGDAEAVSALVGQLAPRLVIHTAYVPGGAELWRIVADGSRYVAAAARRAGARLLHVSTDVVFDGRLGRPYREPDPPSPLTEYGKAKTAAEHAVLDEHPGAVVARTSVIYGGPGGPSGAQERLAGDASSTFYSDELRNPVQVGDLAAALLEIGELEVTGPLHEAGADGISRAELAALLARREVRSTPAPPGRPLDCRLDSSYAGSLIRTRLRGAREVFATSGLA